MDEARLEPTEHGLQPTGDGWFIVNTGELAWETVPGGGTWSIFESADAPSELLGIGVHVLQPGETPGMYHHENEQEGFLVLAGECLAIVEGQERRMGPWDYLHCPPGTGHITIGAGDGPCAILMVGTRRPGHATHYPADPVAARHGAAVATATDSPREAYAGRPPFAPARSPWPPRS
ncbi:MAG: cupin domain-containing protein [Actinomycetota bacterium]|nr:cupin domain-containing protein [Actinomycetota bacterium]